MEQLSSSLAPSNALTDIKPYEPNGLLRWLYRRFFSHIQVDPRWPIAVRRAADRGVVVHVMRSISFLDFLCLDFLTKRFELPRLRFVNDLGLWLLEPFGKGRRRLMFRRQTPEDLALEGTLAQGHSALLFLRRPPDLAHPAYRGRQLDLDLTRVLIEAQRRSDRPILLMPQIFVWNKLPPQRRRTLLDLVFGPSEWPGKLRLLAQFVLNHRHAQLRSGEPFDLQQFVDAHAGLSEERLADKLRYALLRRIEREQRVIVGPSVKTPQRIRDELLRSPRVRTQVEAASRSAKRQLPSVIREADRDLRKLCAAPNPAFLAVIHRVLDRVWNRLYDGLVVDEQGIERVRAAAREGTLVLLPSHKSHMDYVVISDVFYAHDLSCPVIAAGDNLNFWPLGPWLRRAGAFFIRRSLQGRKLYSALLDAYIRKLLLEGFSVEVFLEGGRSRTGALLPPQLGLLAMIVDAALTLRNKPVYFVPISIAYERIIESRSFVHELAGGDKTKEDLGTLLKTPQVFRSRYGRLYVEFGEIFSIDAAVNAVVGAGPAREADVRPGLSPKQRRTLIQHIAQRAVQEINRATVVTPAALVASALLTHRRRGMTHRELLDTANSLLASAIQAGARVSRPVCDPHGAVSDQAVDESVRLFTDARMLVRHGEGTDAIYRVPSDRRIALEYYKNNISHFFTPSALLAISMLSDGAEPVDMTTLQRRFEELSALCAHEVRRAPGETQAFEHVVSRMLIAQEIEIQDDRLRPGPGRAGACLQLYASLLHGYLESYRLALRSLQSVGEQELASKEWVRRTLTLGQRMYLTGEIEKREALSRSKLENVLKSLHDQGCIRLRATGQITVPAGLEARRMLETLESRIVAYLS